MLRCDRRNQSRMTRPQAGKVEASLAPITSLAARIAPKLLPTAVGAIAADQMGIPPPTMRLIRRCMVLLAAGHLFALYQRFIQSRFCRFRRSVVSVS
jgi:hypothetical protein